MLPARLTELVLEAVFDDVELNFEVDLLGVDDVFDVVLEVV